MIKKKSAEKINRERGLYDKSFSLSVAKRRAKRKQIYRLPNGLYVWRK